MMVKKAHKKYFPKSFWYMSFNKDNMVFPTAYMLSQRMHAKTECVSSECKSDVFVYVSEYDLKCL